MDHRTKSALLRRLAAVLYPLEDTVALSDAREHDRCVAQRRGSRRRRRSARTLPGVRTEMVVVAAGAEKRGIRAQLRHQRETNHVTVEGDRFADPGDLEMDVSHDRAGWKPGERVRCSILEFAEETLDIEWEGGHPIGNLPLPNGARPIPIDLDSVLVRIAQIEGLADEMI